MSRATEDLLSQLHSKLAESMVATIDNSDKATLLLTKDRDAPLPDDIVEFLENLREVSPSFMTAAAKFLKDNNITCDPSEDKNLSELDAALKQRRAANRGNVTQIPFTEK